MDTLDPDIAAHIPRILEAIAKLELGKSDLLNKEASPRSVANLEGRLAQLTTIRNALRAIRLELEMQQHSSPHSKKRWS
jgi:hypothetical protein